MKSTLIVSLTCLLYLVLGSLGSVYGSTRSTSLGSVAQALANTFTAYADDHQGNPPESWEELRPYADLQRLERHLGSSLDAKIILFTGIRPTLADDAEGNLIAMTAFPISEDRHGQLGRYIIYRRSFGKYAARWQNEDTIQRALGKAGRVVPPAPIFYEKLFKPLELEYSRPLFEDAVCHGIPREEAERVIGKHASEVSNRRAKAATTWAEIAPSLPSDRSLKALESVKPSPYPSTPAPQQKSQDAPPLINRDHNPLGATMRISLAIISVLLLTGIGVYYFRK